MLTRVGRGMLQGKATTNKDGRRPKSCLGKVINLFTQTELIESLLDTQGNLLSKGKNNQNINLGTFFLI